jgi:CoA:oxalate CoA-transferase
MPTHSKAEKKSPPLAGVRVLDFTIMMAGPYCTRFLADLGADVIKIEAAEGDYIRQRAPKHDGHSAYFGHLNAGKRSVVLDLKKASAISVAKRLAAQSDVIVENFRPGVMARFGLDYATLGALNPRLIYCSLSGFGQTGPDAERPAYAQIVQAASGYESAFAGYQDGNERPANSAIFIADVLGGLFAHIGVLAALNQRHVNGRGQYVDASLMEGMFSLMPYEVQEAQCPQPERRPVYPPLKASDGYLMLAAVSPRNVEALLDGIGVADWRRDPMFATDAGRQANWKSVMGRIEQWTASRTAAECIATISKVGVPVTRYNSVRDALAEPQVAHRGSLAEVVDGAVRYLVPNLPFRLSEGDVRVRPHVPALGEHTEQVLRELLQMSPSDL